MTKVAFMLGALERGGTETLLLDTLKQAANAELDCLLVHRKNGVLLHEFQRTGVPLYHYPIMHSFDPGYFMRLRKLFQTEGIQIVHAQLPLDAFLAYWSSVGTGIRIILSFHGYDFNYSRLAHRLVQFIIQRTSLNLYVSQHLRAHYMAAYSLNNVPQKQKVLYNGVDFGKFELTIKTSIRQELGISPSALLIGSVGNFVAVRDQLTICKFLLELKKKSIDFHFVFVGARSESAPSLYDDCMAFCTANGLMNWVHFIGSRQDVPSILKDLDAFVYASDHDTFGIAVVEAMAVGIPVFVNDWIVMQEITENGNWATLYKTKDINDLITKFHCFKYRKTSFREKAAENAVSVRNTYSIQRHIQTLKEYYRMVV
ncbi:glycosyltransferase [Spirosoma aerolatum]|uniref:glycosyltransferase n=1 Tax=Spirosoma aerolatum TaxID=1211326 RepID=UPI0009AD0875|nr:glycosyltransferase [Spirosoma aerolatum]